MSLSSSSSTQLKFANAEYFTQSSLDEWFCNICTPLSSGHIDYMTLRAAQHHERHSAEHTRNVTETERMWRNSPDPVAWTVPLKHDPPLTTEEVKLRESRVHVDLVQDMVPFWIRGVEAAKKGEVLRLEQFLETLQASDSWAGASPWANDSAHDWGNAWEAAGDNAADDGWGVGNDAEWGVSDELMKRRENPGQKRKYRAMQLKGKGREYEGRQRVTKGHGHNRSNAYEFVEDVARQEEADEERRRSMHRFFDMPTDEKVRKIDEVIRDLLTT